MSQELEMILRLLLAAALGLIIGLQREWKEKQAGVSTPAGEALEKYKGEPF
jgi:uncharacterized membrane protein YhiD involved in acid resistance